MTNFWTGMTNLCENLACACVLELCRSVCVTLTVLELRRYMSNVLCVTGVCRGRKKRGGEEREREDRNRDRERVCGTERESVCLCLCACACVHMCECKITVAWRSKVGVQSTKIIKRKECSGSNHSRSQGIDFWWLHVAS